MAAGSLDQLTEADRFQLLVEAVGDYAIYMLDPEGFVMSWNAGAQNLAGYRAVEVIGRHVSIFFAPEDQAAGVPVRLLQRARTTGRAATMSCAHPLRTNAWASAVRA